MPARLTHNAVLAFHRGICPEDSISGAHRRLRDAMQAGLLSEDPPSWLVGGGAMNDGYLLLEGGDAVLPLRAGRAVSCLIDPGLAGRAR